MLLTSPPAGVATGQPAEQIHVIKTLEGIIQEECWQRQSRDAEIQRNKDGDS
jgi:hypothetical protein